MSARTHRLPRRFAAAGAIAGILLFVVAVGPFSQTSQPEYTVTRHILTIAGEHVEHDEPSVAAAYRINRNTWAAADLPVRVHFNAGDSPSQHEPETLLKNAIAEWSGVSDSYFRFEWAGTTTAGASTCANPFKVDGVNSVTFVTSLSPVTLGITCTVWRPNAGSNAPLLEFDMQLNANIKWGSGAAIQPGEYDLASTILHEMGHAAGLGHPCGSSGSGTCTSAEEASVMYPSLSSQVQKRSLRSDDIEAIVAAYPLAALPPTPVPTALPTAVPTVPQNPAMPFSIRAPQLARD